MSGFPHDNEQYYDVHTSTFVYHWLSDTEKKIYLRKAHQCLKPRGRLGIFCPGKFSEDVAKTLPNLRTLSPERYRDLFREIGLFDNVIVQESLKAVPFKSHDEFKRWFNATCHQDPDPLFVKKYTTVGDDGQIYVTLPYVCSIACAF